MVLLLFAYYLTFTTNLSADVYGISAMHGYKPVELFLLAFNVYDDLKQKLMEKGVPEKEIAFIHDANTEAKKTELFEK